MLQIVATATVHPDGGAFLSQQSCGRKTDALGRGSDEGKLVIDTGFHEVSMAGAASRRIAGQRTPRVLSPGASPGFCSQSKASARQVSR